MIKGIIIVNNNGQARICKFFQSVHQDGFSAEDAQQQVVRKIFQQIAQRPDSFCNYLEGCIPEWGDSTKLIYRHYATLYFVFAVDSLEHCRGVRTRRAPRPDARYAGRTSASSTSSKVRPLPADGALGRRRAFVVFVEALDKCFENVCELDLIFHSDKVHYILDEIVMAGMVLETNIVAILTGVNDQNKLHQKSLSKLNEALGVTSNKR